MHAVMDEAREVAMGCLPTFWTEGILQQLIFYLVPKKGQLEAQTIILTFYLEIRLTIHNGT